MHIHGWPQQLSPLIFFDKDLIGTTHIVFHIIGCLFMITIALIICHPQCFDEAFVVD